MSVSIIIFRTADAHFSQLKSDALILKDTNSELLQTNGLDPDQTAEF